MKTIVLCLQYGDSGKGRVSAYLSKDADWTIKSNGACNAGHTVYDDAGREHKLHHLTAGAVFGKKVAIDTGAAIHLPTLRKELDQVGREVDLYISSNVHIITPEHVNRDSEGSGVGSTKKGVAYVYADRALRKGKRITNDDLNEYGIRATIYRGLPPTGSDSVIYESSQGIMLDIDYGDYPFVTSSSIMPSMAHKIDKVVGVMKAYTTRVGDGPPYHPDIEELRDLGNEYGVTTGRPRRCTWNDIDQLRYAISVTQPDEIVVTKLDIVADMKNICVYEDGELLNIGGINEYKQYLLDTFTQIKWFSESPKGSLIRV